MKRPHLAARGFTLVEVMVTCAITMIVGGMIFLALNAGMNLYAKNTAVNAAHQQARAGVDQMLQNIHGAVSIPQLVDANLQPIAAPAIGPAPGITFQLFDGGPYPVVQNAAATDSYLVLNSSTYTPASNARVNIPSHYIELDVSSSSALSSANRQFNFASTLGRDVVISSTGEDGDSSATYIITAFVTHRVGYLVVGTELRYLPNNDPTSYKVIARNVTSPNPFTIPTLNSGGLNNRYVAAVNISTVEPQYTKRGYAAVNMFISSFIPFRCRLTNTQ
ncbi:MAG: prepilin-type N-terminal cleavage/methylation domain-containing protein [Verrucomicrobiota bacterium]|nr:prepilin-type N-terminal cleavage/methylation domain-containing protein [Verrucomicrobiota bacterium]